MIALPFKRSTPPDIAPAVEQHIARTHPETHPDAFRWDIAEWVQNREAYQRAASDDGIHVNGLEAIAKYHAQLVFILTKLPPDVGIHFLYFNAFPPDPSVSLADPSLSLASIHYERCSTLYNLAALYSTLAMSESRTNPQTIKQATVYYQNSAGCIEYLRTNALPQFLDSLDDITKSQLPVEFSEEFLLGLQELALAQAQECAWQLAILGTQYKNSVLARVAKQVSTLYASSLSHFKNVRPPPPFLPIVELQRLHFDAVSQFRKSDDDHSGHRFGEEVARLRVALRLARQASSHAKANSVPYETGANFIQKLESDLQRATKDNDYIYNQPIPAETALAPIQNFPMAKVQHPEGLTQPKKALRGSTVPFGELMGWGANLAVDLYENRKENLIQDDILKPLKVLERTIAATLTRLSLPASLDALSKPIGIPPSLAAKAGEVRNDNAPQRLQIMSENIQSLAERDEILLNEALDLLDQEASEDESFRKNEALSKSKKGRDRLPSHEANKHLTSKATRFRETIEQARKSDQLVRAKMDEIETDLDLLTLDDEDLEVLIPRTTATDYGSKVTLTKSRELRSLLEKLAETQRASESIMSRIQHLSRVDDIRPRILNESSDLEMWTQVEPAMFEPVILEELVKYERYKQEVSNLEGTVAEMLSDLEEKNKQFLASRKDDPNVKARERTLQKLDIAYHKYKEIVGNLEEGMKFYNDLGHILATYKEECKQWVFERRASLRDLSELLTALSIADAAEAQEYSREQNTYSNDTEIRQLENLTSQINQTAQATHTPVKKLSTLATESEKRLPRTLPPPSLTSRDWKPMTLPSPPPTDPEPTPRKSTRVKKVKEFA